MCMLCGETYEQGKKEALILAEDLKRMAIYNENLAYRKMLPHSEQSKGCALLAKSIIRRLVEDYI